VRHQIHQARLVEIQPKNTVGKILALGRAPALLRMADVSFDVFPTAPGRGVDF